MPCHTFSFVVAVFPGLELDVYEALHVFSKIILICEIKD